MESWRCRSLGNPHQFPRIKRFWQLPFPQRGQGAVAETGCGAPKQIRKGGSFPSKTTTTTLKVIGQHRAPTASIFSRFGRRVVTTPSAIWLQARSVSAQSNSGSLSSCPRRTNSKSNVTCFVNGISVRARTLSILTNTRNKAGPAGPCCKSTGCP